MSDAAGALTVVEARSRYFAEAGFPPDGGYTAKFVKLGQLGPIPIGFPNSDARRKAVGLHDLHHVATGYRTDWAGEAEISAWEIASGCGGFWFAWFINLQGMAMGWVVAPSRTWRAFLRGRHTRNLYREGLSERVLRERVDALRARLELDRPLPVPSARDRLDYAVWCGAAAALALVLLGTPIALAALGLRAFFAG